MAGENSLPLLLIQQLIADRLDGDAWFDLIPVISENLGDVATIVEIAVAKIGCCVVVETPTANCSHPNVPSIDFDEIPIVVTVWENVLLNRDTNNASASQKYALDTAQVIVALIHHYQPEGWNTFIAVTPTITKADDPDLNGYHCRFRISAGLRYQPQASITTEDSRDILTEAGASILPG